MARVFPCREVAFRVRLDFHISTVQRRLLLVFRQGNKGIKIESAPKVPFKRP
jgi:hypothetical protein